MDLLQAVQMSSPLCSSFWLPFSSCKDILFALKLFMVELFWVQISFKKGAVKFVNKSCRQLMSRNGMFKSLTPMTCLSLSDAHVSPCSSSLPNLLDLGKFGVK